MPQNTRPGGCTAKASRRREAAIIGVVWTCGFHSMPTFACEWVPLVQPPRSSSVQHRQPTLTWAGDAGARYRVQVAVVLPESRVLAVHDAEVQGVSFTLPAPIPSERAGIKAMVTRGCAAGDPQALHAQPSWFFVDARSRCALDASGIRAEGPGLTWTAVAGAQAYEVRQLAWDPGRSEFELLAQSTVATPAVAALAGTTTQARVVTVQPVCNGAPGRAVARAIDR